MMGNDTGNAAVAAMHIVDDTITNHARCVLAIMEFRTGQDRPTTRAIVYASSGMR